MANNKNRVVNEFVFVLVSRCSDTIPFMYLSQVATHRSSQVFNVKVCLLMSLFYVLLNFWHLCFFQDFYLKLAFLLIDKLQETLTNFKYSFTDFKETSRGIHPP